jgi:hypothetical protein
MSVVLNYTAKYNKKSLSLFVNKGLFANGFDYTRMCPLEYYGAQFLCGVAREFIAMR